LLYSVGFGIAKGFIYPSSLHAGWSHLPGRKGFVSGVILAGIGIGSFVFGFLTTYLVNPDNEQAKQVEVTEGTYENYFSPEVNSRVPFMFRVLCMFWTV
jgi:hypothetical protein